MMARGENDEGEEELDHSSKVFRTNFVKRKKLFLSSRSNTFVKCWNNIKQSSLLTLRYWKICGKKHNLSANNKEMLVTFRSDSSVSQSVLKLIHSAMKSDERQIVRNTIQVI